MKIKLLYAPIDPANIIGEAAAICYDADTSHGANVRRATSCKDRGHLAVMRFAYATFAISGISRVCSHQLVRIAHAGLLQESQRYVKQSRIEHVIPPAVRNASAALYNDWLAALEQTEALYHRAISEGVRKEDARYILTQGCTTKVNMCLNFQAWQDFLRNRTDKAAQWEIRELALEIERQLHRVAPELF